MKTNHLETVIDSTDRHIISRHSSANSDANYHNDDLDQSQEINIDDNDDE